VTQAGRLAAVRHDLHRARTLALDVVGGPARGRVVLILAAVLALNGADTGTISATTGNLEDAFHIGNTQIGLLLTVVALVGAVNRRWTRPGWTSSIPSCGAGPRACVPCCARSARRPPPLLFGYVSQYVFGGPGSSAATEGSGVGTATAATGLEYTLLLFLIPLSIAGVLALLGLRTYSRDVATAAASVQAINDAEDAGPRSAGA
jgi:hypothetical protein